MRKKRSEEQEAGSRKGEASSAVTTADVIAAALALGYVWRAGGYLLEHPQWCEEVPRIQCVGLVRTNAARGVYQCTRTAREGMARCKSHARIEGGGP